MHELINTFITCDNVGVMGYGDIDRVRVADGVARNMGYVVLA